jgi:hypothetical protein
MVKYHGPSQHMGLGSDRWTQSGESELQSQEPAWKEPFLRSAQSGAEVPTASWQHSLLEQGEHWSLLSMARGLPEVRAEASVITARADGYRTSLGPSGNGGLVGCPTKRIYCGS